MCDTLVALGAATADGVTLFAKNSDRPPSELQVVERVAARRDRGRVRTTYVEVPAHDRDTIPAIISRPSWCWGAEHGVNLAGVAIGNEAIYTRDDPRGAAPGLTGMDLVRLALERAPGAREAVEVITASLARHGQGGSGHLHRFRPYWSSFLVADPHTAFVVETSGRRWAVEEVATNGTRAISNRTTIAAFDAEERHPGQPVETTVDPRLRRSRAVLSRRPVTREALFEHLRGHDDGPWSVCMHVDAREAGIGGEQTTTASLVAELPADGRPPTVWTAPGAPCRTPYTRHHLSA